MCDWKDSRAKQDSLIKRPERAEPETRIDTGASDGFSDDRQEREAPDSGEQSALTFEEMGQGQRSLTGDVAGDEPEWRGDE